MNGLIGCWHCARQAWVEGEDETLSKARNRYSTACLSQPGQMIGEPSLTAPFSFLRPKSVKCRDLVHKIQTKDVGDSAEAPHRPGASLRKLSISVRIANQRPKRAGSRVGIQRLERSRAPF